jgi:ActR/RegA family two-component response regulator
MVASAREGDDAAQHQCDRRLARLVAGDLEAAIIDVGLPDREGDVVVSEVRAMRPSMPIVVATGYASDGLRDRFKGDNRSPFLGKPYEVENLRSVLAELDVFGNGR